jgi:hypothetical protein
MNYILDENRWTIQTLGSHICCSTCVVNLSAWLNEKRLAKLFAVHLVWREPTEYTSHCYFCVIDLSRHTFTDKRSFEYSNQTSALRPVAYSEVLPVPERPESRNLEDGAEMNLGAIGMDTRTDEFSLYAFTFSVLCGKGKYKKSSHLSKRKSVYKPIAEQAIYGFIKRETCVFSKMSALMRHICMKMILTFCCLVSWFDF